AAGRLGRSDRDGDRARARDRRRKARAKLPRARARHLGSELDRPRRRHAAQRSGECENRRVVLSDRTIARLLEEGRIEIDPYDAALLQPSSVDVRVDRYFRVFRNSLYPFIDVKAEQEALTELVEVAEQ